MGHHDHGPTPAIVEAKAPGVNPKFIGMSFQGSSPMSSPMGQEVAQASMRGLLVGHNDGVVAAPPQALAPDVEASRDLGVEDLNLADDYEAQ